MLIVEWEIDAQGKRYRRVGHSIEYEPEITVAGGITIPISQLDDYNQRMKEQEEMARKRAAEAPKPPRKECPFAISGGMTHECAREKCAVFNGDACGLSMLAETAPAETKGKRCPFSAYVCRQDCTLYKSGCILAALNDSK